MAMAFDSSYWDVKWKEGSREAWLGLPHTLTLISANGPKDLELMVESSRDWKIEEQKVQAQQGDVPMTIFRLNCSALVAGDLKLPKMELASHQGRMSVPDMGLKVSSPEVHEGSRIDLVFEKVNCMWEKQPFSKLNGPRLYL